jgi:hypothetical protein
MPWLKSESGLVRLIMLNLIRRGRAVTEAGRGPEEAPEEDPEAPEEDPEAAAEAEADPEAEADEGKRFAMAKWNH